MKTIVTDEETGVLGAKIMFRIKGSKDPNKLYHFFTEIVASERTENQLPDTKSRRKRVNFYLVTGKKPDQWNVCYAETTANEYLISPLLKFVPDFSGANKEAIDAIVKKYHEYRKAGPITQEQRDELNKLFAESFTH